MNQEDVGYQKTPCGEEPYCKKCGSDVVSQFQHSFQDGFSYHDCGEDTCWKRVKQQTWSVMSATEKAAGPSALVVTKGAY